MSTRARMSPPALLDAIIERAERLRAAGVRRVELEGLLAFDLDPPEPAPDPEQDENSEKDWDDPAQYGSKDGYVPGFRKLRERRRGIGGEE